MELNATPLPAQTHVDAPRRRISANVLCALPASEPHRRNFSDLKHHTVLTSQAVVQKSTPALTGLHPGRAGLCSLLGGRGGSVSWGFPAPSAVRGPRLDAPSLCSQPAATSPRPVSAVTTSDLLRQDSRVYSGPTWLLQDGFLFRGHLVHGLYSIHGLDAPFTGPGAGVWGHFSASHSYQLRMPSLVLFNNLWVVITQIWRISH